MNHPEIDRILRQYQSLAVRGLLLARSDQELQETWAEVTAFCHRLVHEYLNGERLSKDASAIQAAGEAMRVMNGDMAWICRGLERQDTIGRLQ